MVNRTDSRGSSLGLFQLLTVIFALLSLPITGSLLGAFPDRDEYVYKTIPANAGPFSYIREEIFEKKEPIDLLVLGSSLLWEALKVPDLRRSFSSHFGKEKEVISLCSNWRGEDLLYVLLKDVLKHRTVRVVLMSMPTVEDRFEGPHLMAHYWLDYSEHGEILPFLPISQRAAIWATQILGSGRKLLSSIRPDGETTATYDQGLYGWHESREGYRGEPFQTFSVNIDPPIGAERLIYGPKTAENFVSLNDEINQYQRVFLRGIDELLRKRSVPLIILNVPKYRYRTNEKVFERMDWSHFFTTNSRLVGVSPNVLFNGLDEGEIKKLYYDDHLNRNGAEFYTKVVTPGIMSAYEQLDGVL